MRRVRRKSTPVKRRSVLSRRKPFKALNFEVESHIAREIWAVLYLALAALTWLSLNAQLGFLGDLWVSALKPVFGVGVSAVPFVLLGMGASVFFSKKIQWGLSRLTGVFLLCVALLGFVHMTLPEEEILQTAKAGGGGGYIGFVGSFIFSMAFGRVGAYVSLTASLLIGILLSFQLSLGALIRAFIPSLGTVKKVIEVATPEIHILENGHETSASDSKFDDLKIVSPGALIPSEIEESAMTLKEMTMEEVEARLQKQAEDREEDEREALFEEVAGEDMEGEIVSVDGKDISDEALIEWEYPSLELLEATKEGFELNASELKNKASLIRAKFEQFGINVTMQEVHVGPTVVQYTLKPADGVKLSKITSLKNDLALALAAPAVRIEAPIPGKSLVGIEIPNSVRATVHMREIMESASYKSLDSDLKLALGRDVSGNAIAADLTKMPHLLIAGATGSGKSVGMNSFLISMLYNNSPKELKFIMIDPKKVELVPYNGLPHLLTPVITDPEKAATALRWAVAEMNRRYQVFADAGHRNIKDYNRGKRKENRMSKIVIVIDELADLMMTAQKEVEASICRIAQMARAVGMHLMVATQRPSVDVITGLIKANIPARIAFTVSSSVDSRTILDGQGAEDLLGSGDMLYLSGTMGKPMRIQGIYITPDEIEKVTRRLKLTREPQYDEDITSRELKSRPVQGVPDVFEGSLSDDDLMSAAIECLRKNRKSASTSSLQRYLKIGYSRAARIVDMLEEAGVVGPSRGSKPRDVFLKEE